MIDASTRKAVAEAIDRAVARTLADVDAGESENEVDMTSRLAARIKDELNAIHAGDVRISAKVRTLQDRGRGAAERRYGADLLVVVRIDTPSTAVTKGVLVQSKRAGHEGVALRGTERVSIGATQSSDRLRTQCAKMKALSAESFVWVYGEQDIRAAKATAVTEVRGNSETVVRSSPLPAFFGEILDCSIGDEALSATDDATLDALGERVDASTTLAVEVLQGRSEEVFSERTAQS